jgi:large subunit ribosomal protein L23
MSKLANQLRKKADILKRPHVTESTSAAALNDAHPVYTFEVTAGANKAGVCAAVKELFNVTPIKVNILNVRPKTIIIRGHRGQKPGMKKALVFLKPGDKIDFV